ncbi:MAG: aminotransferase class I/II-fold pyridoxal phosphate-dependent enzyme [Cyanobacteria bacterium J06650_10]
MLACLSVRSGFDALLTVLDLNPGDEVLVSAITIPGMIHIIEAHGLVPVPLDMDMERLSVAAESMAAAVSDRTKMILVAHLFGSRMQMEPIVEFAKTHNLFVVEDCAQVYQGNVYRGYPKTDVCLFSFGPIKTATALGGGLLCFQSDSLCETVRAVQAQWPKQSRMRFFKRLCKYIVLMLLSYRVSYTLFVGLCSALNCNHDLIITSSVRGFSGDDFFVKIRKRPCAPLLSLLERRIRQFDVKRIYERIALANDLIALTPLVARPGSKALCHTHWVFPVVTTEAERLIQYLWQQGFDATQSGSSLRVLNSSDHPLGQYPERMPAEAIAVLPKLVYVPLYNGLSTSDIARLADALQRFYGDLHCHKQGRFGQDDSEPKCEEFEQHSASTKAHATVKARR